MGIKLGGTMYKNHVGEQLFLTEFFSDPKARIIEGLNDAFVQVIVGGNCISLLTPGLASKTISDIVLRFPKRSGTDDALNMSSLASKI